MRVAFFARHEKQRLRPHETPGRILRHLRGEDDIDLARFIVAEEIGTQRASQVDLHGRIGLAEIREDVRQEIPGVQVRCAEPDGVFIPGLLTDFTSIVKEVYRGGFDSKIVSLSIAADANGRFLKNVGGEVAEGIDHYQPAPPTTSPTYKNFIKLMGAPEGTVYLFAGNAYDQMWTTALAMEKAGTDESAVWTKSAREVSNPPGAMVDDGLEALKMIRAGKKVAYVGAGADCDFDDIGDQLNRHFLHRVIKDGKNEFVQIIS